MGPNSIIPNMAKKAKRDPAKPKKSKSAYQFFCLENRERVRNANPEAKNTEMFSLLSEQWKQCQGADREKYIALADQDKLRYKDEMAEYTPTPGFEKTSKRKKKDPDAPKRPPSAYQLFSQAHRDRVVAENPDVKHTEYFKLLSQKWKAANEQERAPFVARANLLKAAYLAAKTQYDVQKTLEAT